MHQARPVTGGRLALAQFFAPLLLAAGLFLSANPSHSQNASLAAPNAHQVEAEGELLVLHEDDFKTKTSRTRHFLKTTKGRIELRFKGKTPQLRTGTKLRVKGEQTGNILALDPSGSTNLTVTATAPLTNTLGEQKTVVLLVNFQDNPIQPYALTDANNTVFSQASNFYKENSQQQTWLTGATYGWYTLPLSQTTCDLFQIESAAKQAATAAGVDLSPYSHYVYAFPNTSACAWGGLATVGGAPGSIWLNGSLSLFKVSHEFGHNLGLQHSHSLECGAATVGTSCTTYDYGDTLDVMGGSNPGHFNALQKERLGWLNSGTMPPITTVQTSGTYALAAFEPTSTSPKALKILKSTDPTTGVKSWYYVEYRTASGADNFIASITGTNITNGVIIHTGTDGNGSTSNLLDMTPNSSIYFSYDWNDPALAVGQSYTDTLAGVTITPTGVNGTSAGVNVSFGQTMTNCGRASPVLTPATQSQSTAAGTTLTYGVTLTNKDNAACGASNFALQAAPPSGWTTSFAASTLSIAPGASASTTLSVTSPATATGANLIGIGATNSAVTSYTGSASATYQVGLGLDVSVATDKASYAPGQTVKMTSTVKSGAAAVAGATVTFTINQPNGAVVTLIATTNGSGVATASYKIGRKNATGTYQLRAYASGLSLSANSATSFSVQ